MKKMKTTTQMAGGLFEGRSLLEVLERFMKKQAAMSFGEFRQIEKLE